MKSSSYDHWSVISTEFWNEEMVFFLFRKKAKTSEKTATDRASSC
jgi:hypothetical protein